MYDKKNKGVLSVCKSAPEGGKYFGIDVPATAEGHVRIDIKRGYHYFQRIDENKTRYVNIFNTDPQLQYTPAWLLNSMMTKVCYQLLVAIEEKAVSMLTSENIYTERIRTRADFYNKIETEFKKAVALDE